MGGLRVALEQIKALTEIPFAHTAGDHELIYQIATEALAQQTAAVVYQCPQCGTGMEVDGSAKPSKKPAAVVELTDLRRVDAELAWLPPPSLAHSMSYKHGYRDGVAKCRAVIAAHEKKQGRGQA